MCWLTQYINHPAVQKVLANDFKCGYAAATAVVLLLIILFLIAKFIIWLCFRTPKCSEVVVKRAGGDIVISAKVISSLIARELAAGGRLNDARIYIRVKRKGYEIFIKAAYTEGVVGLPEIVDKAKPQIFALLKDQFGIENVSAVNITVDRLSDPEENDNSGF